MLAVLIKCQNGLSKTHRAKITIKTTGIYVRTIHIDTYWLNHGNRNLRQYVRATERDHLRELSLWRNGLSRKNPARLWIEGVQPENNEPIDINSLTSKAHFLTPYTENRLCSFLLAKQCCSIVKVIWFLPTPKYVIGIINCTPIIFSTWRSKHKSIRT